MDKRPLYKKYNVTRVDGKPVGRTITIEIDKDPQGAEILKRISSAYRQTRTRFSDSLWVLGDQIERANKPGGYTFKQIVRIVHDFKPKLPATFQKMVVDTLTDDNNRGVSFGLPVDVFIVPIAEFWENESLDETNPCEWFNPQITDGWKLVFQAVAEMEAIMNEEDKVVEAKKRKDGYAFRAATIRANEHVTYVTTPKVPFK